MKCFIFHEYKSLYNIIFLLYSQERSVSYSNIKTLLSFEIALYHMFILESNSSFVCIEYYL